MEVLKILKTKTGKININKKQKIDALNLHNEWIQNKLNWMWGITRQTSKPVTNTAYKMKIV